MITRAIAFLSRRPWKAARYWEYKLRLVALGTPTQEVVLNLFASSGGRLSGAFYLRAKDVKEKVRDLSSPYRFDARAEALFVWLSRGAYSLTRKVGVIPADYEPIVSPSLMDLATNGRTRCFCHACGMYEENVMAGCYSNSSKPTEAFQTTVIVCRQKHVLHEDDMRVAFTLGKRRPNSESSMSRNRAQDSG